MSLWKMSICALCIGMACAMLQPMQPQSIIATVLLTTVVLLIESSL